MIQSQKCFCGQRCGDSDNCHAYSFSVARRIDTAEPRRFAYDDNAEALPIDAPCEAAERIPLNRRGSAEPIPSTASAAPVRTELSKTKRTVPIVLHHCLTYAKRTVPFRCPHAACCGYGIVFFLLSYKITLMILHRISGTIVCLRFPRPFSTLFYLIKLSKILTGSQFLLSYL